tara:strand:- start:114 stop:1154 length:1041 start_codon:yes stop_codon:yes gene_type:complete
MDYRFVIFGKIIHTDYFVKLLSEYGFEKPLVIISLDEEYHRDKRLLSPYGLDSKIEELAKEGLCDLYKMKTINCAEAISLFDEYKVNIGISINCRNIIKKEIIDYFDSPIFNLHDSYLPDERGGALNSWRILNNINEVGNTLHHLDEGIDTGDIVLQEKTTLDKKFPYPKDYLKAESLNCQKILSKFIRLLSNKEPINAFKQENDKSYYYPRLYTEINGIVDWDSDVYEIERFIRAFSYPYPGAFSYYRGKKVHILSSKVEQTSSKFHSFANGKIVTVMDDMSVRVIAGGKSLIIEKISVEEEVITAGNYLNVKYSLHSPIEEKEKARNHIPTTLEMNKSEDEFKG